MTESVISDEQIATAFLGTAFGRADFRELLGASVVKKLVGYHCGHTVTTIMQKMGLIGKTGKPTQLGIKFAREYL